MALKPVNEQHQLQITAGTEGRLQGHKFEELVTIELNNIDCMVDEIFIECNRPNIYYGNPAKGLVYYISKDKGKKISRLNAYWLGGLATVNAGAKILNKNGEIITGSKSDILIDVRFEDGTTENKYYADAIYKAVSAFVKDYNSMIDATGDSSDTSVLRTATNMVNTTKANSKVLKELGISVDSNNKLVIDKDTFMAADMSVAKSAFAGAGSFGQSVANSAASIYSSSATTLAKLQTQNLYGSDGSYSYVSASVYNQFT